MAMKIIILSALFCLCRVTTTIAQEVPYTLPQKEKIDSGPDEISPERGNTDPLNKQTKLLDSKKVITAENQVNEFVGVVQFVKGSVTWSGTERKDPIQFKTLFRWNESALVEQNSYVKFISRGRCTAVAYGKSQIQSPLPSADSSWNFNGGSARWICGPEQSDHLRVDGHALSLSDAEIFYHRLQLYVVRGRVLSESGELPPGATYIWKKQGWKVEYSSDDAFHSWKLNQDLEAPKESYKLTQPKRKVSSRWSLGPLGGNINFNHANYLLELDDNGTHGARLQANFKLGDKSYLVGLNFYESDKSDNDEGSKSHSGPPSTFYVSNRLESFVFDLGLRSQFERQWAWFFRAGIGHDILGLDSYGPSFSIHRDVSSLSGRVSLGVDRILFAESLGWGGLFISGEIYFHQALMYQGTKKREQEYFSGPEPTELDRANEKFAHNAWGILVHLAPLVQF